MIGPPKPLGATARYDLHKIFEERYVTVPSSGAHAYDGAEGLIPPCSDHLLSLASSHFDGSLALVRMAAYQHLVPS